MLPRKIFESLNTALELFYSFLNNFQSNLCKFFDPNYKCFAKYDAFCSHIFDYACLRRKNLIFIEEV